MADYGVLLPMQLETRFIPPRTSAERPGTEDLSQEHWRLRVRIVPDRASVAARRTAPDALELAALQALLSTLSQDPAFPDPVPDEPELRHAALAALDGWADAFDRLAQVVGAARAARLVGTVPIAGSPPQVPEGAATEGWLVPEVLGLPDDIDVWAVWAGGDPDAPAAQPTILTTLHPKAHLLSLDPLPSAGADLDARWWGSWEAAVAAGLAEERELDRHPSEIEVLGVSGLGTADGGAEALFAAHAEAGDLAVLRAGVPTSTAFGSPTAGETDAAQWARGHVTTHPTVTLLGGAGIDARVPVDPLLWLHEDWSRRIVAGCYPALWGYGLQGVLGIVRDPRETEHLPEHAAASLRLWEWASEWLRPEGVLPPIRIGDQAYGVLALAAPSSEVVDGLGGAVGAGIDPVTATPLAPALGRMARGWALAAERGLADGDPRRRIRHLVHGPVPARLRRQDLIPVVTDAIRSHRDAFDELETAWAERAAVARTLGQEEHGWRAHGRLYRAFGPSRRLGIPVLGPGIDGGTEQPDAQLFDDFLDRAVGTVFRLSGPEIPAFLRRDRAPESLLMTLHHRSVAVSTQLLWNADPSGAIDETDALARPGLLEPLGAPQAGDTRAAAQADRLSRSGEADDLEVPDFAHRALDPGSIAEVLKACAEEPALRPVASRAVRALADASAGRWDAWLAGLGAAHASEAAAAGGMPALGVYGWVDAPYRGTPGPGPGGFHLAPSRGIAGTLAVLRDRAVVDPERWAMQHDSAVVGAARRWIGDLELGWHPAELLGRMIEQAISEAPGLSATEAATVIAELRKAHPLVPDQGGFGCTHGLDAIAAASATAHPAVTAAIEGAERLLQAAADLELAEGVHGIVTDRPARAAAAMRGLAGAGPLPVPTWMEPEQPARPVATVVLLATAPAAPAPNAGPAASAAPALDAQLRRGFASEPAWIVARGEQRVRITASDLDCSLLDLATLDSEAVRTMASLAALAGLGTEIAASATVDDGLGEIRAWVSALHGRAAAVADVAPESSPDAAAAQSDAAVDALGARLDVAIGAAASLREGIAAALASFAESESARVEAALRARDEGGGEPVGPLDVAPLTPGEVEQLATLAVAAGRWGFAPPSSAASIDAADAVEARQATSDLLGFLELVEQGLSTRLDAAQPVAEHLAGTLPRERPIASRPDAAAVAAALAELVGRQGLPIGAPLTAVAALQPGGDDLAAWARTIAAVRADLALTLGVGDGQLAPVAGLTAFATDPDDPWRVDELRLLAERPDGEAPAETRPAPRLTVALAAEQPQPGETWEWVVLDSFVEHVPTSRPVAGASFDAASPSARPPQAILIVPPADLQAPAPSAEEVRGSVLYARMLAHGRVAVASDLEQAGLGPLAAWAALPQDERTGARLGPDVLGSSLPDQPAVLVPDPDDGDDIARAVTGDALWMLGQQWRLGEHAGEDAATPLQLRLGLRTTTVSHTAANPGLPLAASPLEAAIEAEASPGEAAAWRSDALRFASSVELGEGASLDVPTHDAGVAGWWSITAAAPVPDGAAQPEQLVRPGRLSWSGAPTGRYWQIEDRRTDVAGDGPDRTQPALLHLIDVISRVGEDLFVAPVAAAPGVIARPTGVTITDAAGGTWPLISAEDWNLIGIARADPPRAAGDPAMDWHRAVPILVPGAGALEGPILDDVGLALDEDDNLLWVADLRASDASHPTTDVASVAPPDDTSDIAWRWILRRSVPRGRFPYLHGFAIAPPSDGHGEDAFVRADLVEPDGSLAPGPTSRLIGEMPRLLPLAVPASGVRLVRRAILARSIDGQPIVWHRRERRPRDVPVDVDVRWDALVRAETAPPEQAETAQPEQAELA